MLPAACQGIVGVTVREEDAELRGLLAQMADPSSWAAAEAERAMLGVLDGSCRTPIGAYVQFAEGAIELTGLVARADGSFLLRRTLRGTPADAAALGGELGRSLRADSPADIFAP
jgi:hydroxymethylbilane synthase